MGHYRATRPRRDLNSQKKPVLTVWKLIPSRIVPSGSETKEIATQHQLEVFSVMNSKHWSCPLSDAEDAVRAESREGMLDSIATATVVGADAVLLVPAVVNEATHYEAAYERSQAEIRKLIPEAREKRYHDRH